MMRNLYRGLMRGPRFKGRGRIENAFRAVLKPAVDTVNGFRMELDPLEWTQISYLSGRLPEPQTLALFARLVGRGDTCLDVGAHVGLQALTMARAAGPSGKVLAIDPQPYNCERLLVNAELNGLANILTIVAAAGAEDGFMVLNNQKRNDKTRLTLAGEGVSDVAVKFEAPVTRLDTLSDRHGLGAIALMKIDVEGYELEVLEGAQATLERTQNLVFEALPETDVESARKMAAVLKEAGFSLQTIAGEDWTPGQIAPENNIWARRA